MCDCQCATGLHRGTPLTFELLDSNSLICVLRVLGGGIELPCSYFIYGNRKKKADVRGKLRKAERSLYGI